MQQDIVKSIDFRGARVEKHDFVKKSLACLLPGIMWNQMTYVSWCNCFRCLFESYKFHIL